MGGHTSGSLPVHRVYPFDDARHAEEHHRWLCCVLPLAGSSVRRRAGSYRSVRSIHRGQPYASTGSWRRSNLLWPRRVRLHGRMFPANAVHVRGCDLCRGLPMRCPMSTRLAWPVVDVSLGGARTASRESSRCGHVGARNMLTRRLRVVRASRPPNSALLTPRSRLPTNSPASAGGSARGRSTGTTRWSSQVLPEAGRSAPSRASLAPA